MRRLAYFNRDISYIQGMIDLMLPILFAYIPNWENGEPLSEVEKFEPIIFWCNDQMLRRDGSFWLVRDIYGESKRIIDDSFKIIDRINPFLSLFLRIYDLENSRWIYPELILKFQRIFYKDSWILIFQTHCGPDPEHWLSYMVAAVHILTFSAIASAPSLDISMVAVTFETTIRSFNPGYIGKVALWLYKTVPLEFPSRKVVKPPPISSCEFFSSIYQ